MRYVAQLKAVVKPGTHARNSIRDGQPVREVALPVPRQVVIQLYGEPQDPCIMSQYDDDDAICGKTWHTTLNDAFSKAECEYGLAVHDFSQEDIAPTSRFPVTKEIARYEREIAGMSLKIWENHDDWEFESYFECWWYENEDGHEYHSCLSNLKTQCAFALDENLAVYVEEDEFSYVKIYNSVFDLVRLEKAFSEHLPTHYHDFIDVSNLGYFDSIDAFESAHRERLQKYYARVKCEGDDLNAIYYKYGEVISVGRYWEKEFSLVALHYSKAPKAEAQLTGRWKIQELKKRRNRRRIVSILTVFGILFFSQRMHDYPNSTSFEITFIIVFFVVLAGIIYLEYKK